MDDKTVDNLQVISKSGKKILVTRSDGKFWPPLFKGLASYLEDEEIADTMTSNEISRKFVWERIQMTHENHIAFVTMLRENSSLNICTCGKKELVEIFYVTHILSTTRCVIGSSCIKHWFNSDEEFKFLNEPKYLAELLNFNISKKIIQFDEDNTSYCKVCLTKYEAKRCPCGNIDEEKKKEYDKKRKEKKRIQDEIKREEERIQNEIKREKERIQNEIVYIDKEKNMYYFKDRAKEYAKKNNITFLFNGELKKWYSIRKHAYLFEIFDVEIDDKIKKLFYFEIDWNIFE